MVEIFGFEISREALIRALVILVLASMPSVAWFFKVRRKMIEATVKVIRSIEEAVKPRDQRYWLHGYLVGFAAKYWVRRGGVERVYVNFTMPPYHAFFYLPIIFIFKKRERLEVAVEYSKPLGVRGEAHLFDYRKRSVRVLVERDVKALKGRSDMAVGFVTAAGKRLKYYARGEGALSLALSIAEKLSEVGEVFRVSVVPSRRMLIAVVTPKSPSLAGEAVRLLMEGWGMKRLAGGREEATS